MTLRTHPKAAVEEIKVPQLAQGTFQLSYLSQRSTPSRQTGLSHPLWKKWKIDHRPRSSERRSSRCITRISEISPRTKTPKGKRRTPPCQPFANSSSKIERMRKTKILSVAPYLIFARACLCIYPLPFPPTYPTRTST